MPLIRRLAWPLIALALGTAFVAWYDATVAGSRYPFSSDSASYLEMADSLRHWRWPSVVPWGSELAAIDRVAQPLFPPGFPLLTALAAPWAGGLRSALMGWPRVAAALLPVLLLLAFRGALADGLLCGLGLALLGTQGILYWHFVGYSDLPGLWLSILALGLCWQACRILASDRRRSSAWLVALGGGFAAGASYAVRNAGIAVMAAGLGFWCLEALRDARARRPAAAFVAGLLPWLLVLRVYNLAALGALSAYSMPVSTRPWTQNLADWVSAQIMDLQVRAPDAPPLSLASAVAVLIAAAAAGTAVLVRTRERTARAALSLLLGYAAIGGVLVVASRSRYEWGGIIDSRHALQYTWALLLAAAIACRAMASGVAARLLPALLLLACGLLGAIAVSTAEEEVREPEALARLAADPGLIRQVRELGRHRALVSNEAAFLRIESGLAVRQTDFIGDDAALRDRLVDLRDAVWPRPLSLILVCEPFSGRLPACTHALQPAPLIAPCRWLRAAEPRVFVCEPDGLPPPPSPDAMR